MSPKRKSEMIFDLAGRLNLDRKLAAYLTASASVTAVLSSEAQAIVISNSIVQPFGINGEVNIDLNSDGQIDYQIDHDRVDLTGGVGPVRNFVDYLQLDKNDVSSAANPYPIDNFGVFPINGTAANADHGYMTNAGPGESGYYPSANLSGAQVGPLSNGWDFQEGDNFIGSHKTIRANRLIDEDATQIDAANPNPPAGSTGQFVPLGTQGWVGLSGQTRYLGVRVDLNDAGHSGFNNDASQYWYGWIGVRITNEADATGEVVGWGYDTQVGASILAGTTGGRGGDYNNDGKVDARDYVIWRKGSPLQNETVSPGSNTAADYTPWRLNYGATSAGSGLGLGSGSAVPEPGSALLALLSGFSLICVYFGRRLRGK